jgi:hypothetical protein
LSISSYGQRKMKTKRFNNFNKIYILKLFIILVLLALFYLLYNKLFTFTSYVNRRQVTPRIAQHCSQYNANNIIRNKIQLPQNIHRRRVGFFLIATGKYIELARRLIDSTEKHFCSNSPHIYVHYFIFTDNTQFNPTLTNGDRNFTIIFQKHLEWPMSTLLRFENILKVCKIIIVNRFRVFENLLRSF